MSANFLGQIFRNARNLSARCKVGRALRARREFGNGLPLCFTAARPESVPCHRHASFALVVSICLIAVSVSAQEKPGFKFAFAPGSGPNGRMPVAPDMLYSPARGYGFEPGADVKVESQGLVTSRQPFLFSVKVPE